MAELDVRTIRGGRRRATRVLVRNLGPETVILTAIAASDPDQDFMVGGPLPRDLELLPLTQPHEFMVAPGLNLPRPLFVDITFTDKTGSRTKSYPIYA